MDTGGFVESQTSKSKKIPITGFRANGLFSETLFLFFFSNRSPSLLTHLTHLTHPIASLASRKIMGELGVS